MEWVSVHDDLPVDGEKVLVRYGRGTLSVKEYGIENFSREFGWSNAPVIAWAYFDKFLAPWEEVEKEAEPEGQALPEGIKPFEDTKFYEEPCQPSGKSGWFSKWFCPGE